MHPTHSWVAQTLPCSSSTRLQGLEPSASQDRRGLCDSVEVTLQTEAQEGQVSQPPCGAHSSALQGEERTTSCSSTPAMMS
jgi:hypothetical protein